MSIQENIIGLKKHLPKDVTLIAVSKTHTVEAISQAYEAGQRVFGENKVQEMCNKYEQLPKDIEWHLIGHLQSNKVKYIAPFVSLIHSVDSFKLLAEINKQGQKNNRVINCLLQLHIASEETKFGLNEAEADTMLLDDELPNLKNIQILGCMGMASNTDDHQKVRNEFRQLKIFFDAHKNRSSFNVDWRIISMGMSGDYPMAIEEGSNMIRVGSAIFGAR
jgi:pyridoxal phosphate enzyme (YggS family)